MCASFRKERQVAKSTGFVSVPFIESQESLSRGVAQHGSAPQWGCGGRVFKSLRPDHFQIQGSYKAILLMFFSSCLILWLNNLIF